jgi:2-iminobutanoate/2-iminopropanoate deaminase
MQQIISSAEAPGAIGPYSQAIKHGDFVFLSGQLPIHAADGTIPGDITGQTRQALVNMQHVLAAAGCTVDDVVKTTCYLSDMSLFQQMNEVYASVFQNVHPARTTIAAKELPKGVLVEIDCIAIHSKK